MWEATVGMLCLLFKGCKNKDYTDENSTLACLWPLLRESSEGNCKLLWKKLGKFEARKLCAISEKKEKRQIVKQRSRRATKIISAQ
jgi:hypothetical protein